MNTALDRSRVPAPGPPTEAEVADPLVFTLDNGLEVIVVPDHRLPLVSMQLRADVPPTAFGPRAGLPDLFGELLPAGTTRHDKDWIDETVDGMGAHLQANAEGLYTTCLREHVAPMLALMAEVATSPAFPPDEFEKTRRRMRSAVAQRAHDPEALAEVIGRHVLFGAHHPYGEVVTEATLQRIAPAQLHQWHAHAFRPANAYLVLVGDIRADEARALAGAHFGGWTHAADAAGDMGRLPVLRAATLPGTGRHIHVLHRTGARQSVLRMGFPLDLPPGHPQALAARVMNTILGGGIFNARLMANLREDKGWTYGAYSALDVDRHNASLAVHVSLRTDATGAAVTEIAQEMDRMCNAEVAPAELELARSHLAGAFGRSLEDPRTLAQFALNIRLNDLPPDHYRTYLRRLHAVTAADVLQAARTFLHPAHAAVLVVGDRDAVAPALEPLGLLQGIDAEGLPAE